MRVNTQNTKKILKEVEKDFDIHIPFLKKDYRNFSENFSRMDSFSKDDYQHYLQSYIYDNDIFAKIVQNCCKDNARFFSKYFPEFKDNLFLNDFGEVAVGFVSDYVNTQVDLNEMVSDIYRSVEYLFFKEIAFLLIYRNYDRLKADNIIDENIDEIESACWDCFSIDDVYNACEQYIN